ncbi:MAG: hypothetical protein FD131_4811 [Rhodocyclaceae bacterium]|nr:MAG: hypothetical protein FD131_4811 [Rhodocyclaceae bacterium]
MKRTRNGAKLVGRIVTRLRDTYQPSQVFLFGSYAQGRQTRDSDLDLLIIKDTAKPFFKRLFEVRTLVSPLVRRQPFDPIVLTPKELNKRLARGDQFLQGIVRKGKLVYGKR